MKYFILLAIIFFSFRVFSEDTYYYEGRYYKIDEYIRFLDDPHYQTYLLEKKAEKNHQRVGVEEYFAKKEREAYVQEQSRKAHVGQLNEERDENEFLKLEADHEKQKEKDLKAYLELQKQYLVRKDFEESQRKPSRMIASIFETSEDQPLKRIPLSKRKYHLKPKAARPAGK